MGDDEIKKSRIDFTCDEKRLKEAKFHIVAVPTPVNTDHTPDLTPVTGASRILGRNLSKGSIVVYIPVLPRMCACLFWKKSHILSAEWILR